MTQSQKGLFANFPACSWVGLQGTTTRIPQDTQTIPLIVSLLNQEISGRTASPEHKSRKVKNSYMLLKKSQPVLSTFTLRNRDGFDEFVIHFPN